MGRHLLAGLFNCFCIRSRRRKKNKAETSKEGNGSMLAEARKDGMILRRSGTMEADGSNCFVCVHSKRGEKGVNQDCSMVWKEYGGLEDMLFLGIFDGHGPWGHYVANHVGKSLPASVICGWQESLDDKKQPVDVWKHVFLKSSAAVDEGLRKKGGFDSFHSGTTALMAIKQGELLMIANVGDSRAVLATTDDDGNLIPIQLTYELKPDLPEEAERISQCQGLVACLDDEPGVHRLWLPDGETPGLAVSRAFGDHCLKSFGLISTPEVSHRFITSRDKFLLLATDGVWDVISNKEAVAIVSSTPDRGKSAKRLVESAVKAWHSKRRNVAVDDCSAVCVFFNAPIPK